MAAGPSRSSLNQLKPAAMLQNISNHYMQKNKKFNRVEPLLSQQHMVSSKHLQSKADEMIVKR